MTARPTLHSLWLFLCLQAANSLLQACYLTGMQLSQDQLETVLQAVKGVLQGGSCQVREPLGGRGIGFSPWSPKEPVKLWMA
jgi:hypothetical protein